MEETMNGTGSGRGGIPEIKVQWWVFDLIKPFHDVHFYGRNPPKSFVYVQCFHVFTAVMGGWRANHLLFVKMLYVWQLLTS